MEASGKGLVWVHLILYMQVCFAVSIRNYAERENINNLYGVFSSKISYGNNSLPGKAAATASLRIPEFFCIIFYLSLQVH